MKFFYVTKMLFNFIILIIFKAFMELSFAKFGLKYSRLDIPHHLEKQPKQLWEFQME